VVDEAGYAPVFGRTFVILHRIVYRITNFLNQLLPYVIADWRLSKIAFHFLPLTYTLVNFCKFHNSSK